MEKLLANKRAIVTGGSRGLGLAIARALANDGAHVLVIGRSEEGCSKAVARIRDLGGLADACIADLTDPASADRVVEACFDSFGGLEILVNNAGVFVYKDFLKLEREDFDRTIATNLAGPFYLSQRAAALMAKQGQGGSIINISSIHGKVGDPKVVPHCASKAGLIGLTQAMAEALREHDIRVNAICPGAIDGESSDRRSTSPQQKVTQADIATLAAFLASDLSASMSGAAIDAYGCTHTPIKV